ncbi:MAG: flavin reductase [Symbiobacteriaceae bacterium]|nr:flavin reductase [Symbiobacteriaceae bacterium]
MSELSFLAETEKQIEQLYQKGGAFLTTQYEESINTMTIGWGTIGFIWGKPVFMVAVRPSRYTFGLLEKSLEFTVTIPCNDDFRLSLDLCGSTSGRDHDKITAAGLTISKSIKITTPIIQGVAWQYECKVIYRHEMQQGEILHPQMKERLYNPVQGPLHVLYFGEILSNYLT